MFPSLVISNWSETPFRLMSAHLRAEYLSVPELREYMRLNSDFPPPLLAPFLTHLHYRLALPWTGLILVFIAAPLGIGYARRRVLSNVAAAILLVLTMNFATHFFLALGEGNRIPAWAAAWTPNFLFATIGVVMLYLRATNQEPRSLFAFARARSATS
jgi:lipopolysaccharide export system permease protein